MNQKTRTLVIINQRAARARRTWPQIRNALLKNGISFDAHETTHAGDATTRVRAALLDGYKIIAVVGGDGTLSEAASGFFQLDGHEKDALSTLPLPVSDSAVLAILPAGTGDDFARGLVGNRQPVEKWTESLIAYCRSVDGRRARTVDVICASAGPGAHPFICLNVATIGLGAEVASRVAAQNSFVQRLPGEARFVAAACTALALWRERRVRVTVDGSSVIECGSNLIAVANGVYAGGGMMFAPAASTDDGQIDLIVACDITRATILRELPRIRRGGHLANPNVRSLRATHIRVETLEPEETLPVEADGNVRGHTPAEFRIMHGALKIVVPE